METVNLNKKLYAKNQYERVINTKFSQLATTPSPTTPPATISVDEFFQIYNQLFFQIPKEGEINSHEYLIKTSSEYINFTPINEDIEALISEINALQQQNLELNQQLIDLQSTGSSSNNSPELEIIRSLNNENTTQNITQNNQTGTQRATRGRG